MAPKVAVLKRKPTAAADFCVKGGSQNGCIWNGLLLLADWYPEVVEALFLVAFIEGDYAVGEGPPIGNKMFVSKALTNALELILINGEVRADFYDGMKTAL